MTDAAPASNSDIHLTAPIPVEDVAGLVSLWAAKAWPHLDFDVSKLAAALKAVRRVDASDRDSVSLSAFAPLAFAPPNAIPKSDEQLTAYLSFFEDELRLFFPHYMSPEAFFGEFEQVFGNDWAKLKAVHKPFNSLLSMASDLGNFTAKALGLEVGVHPLAFSGSDAEIAIEERLAERVFSGRGYGELINLEEARIAIKHDGEMSDEVAIAAYFQEFSSTGILPADLAGLSATDLVEKLGFTIDELIDPENGLIVDKYKFHEKEIGGLTFQAIMGARGPYLEAKREFDSIGTVPFGVALIASPTDMDDTEKLYVCKYDGNQPAIDLSSLSVEQVIELANEFGLGMGPFGTPKVDFDDSPAFEGLVSWIQNRPELADEIAGRRFDYLPGVLERATASLTSAGPRI